MCGHAKVLQLCPTLCNPMDCDLPGSSVHGIFQARILAWVAMPFSRGTSQPKIKHACLTSSAWAGIFFFFLTTGSTGKLYIHHQSVSSVAQLCLTLCDPMNRSMLGLPVQHQLPEFTQTHVHRVSDAIQPSHPLSSPSPPALNPSQHQSLFQ